jgi:hypothetical protein
MSYDLILKTPQGTLLPLSRRKQLLEDFRNETNLDGPCEITDLEMDPDKYDAETLERCLESGEVSRSEFEAFCEARNLSPRSDEYESHNAARLFLDASWGQRLFSPNMPCTDDETREAYCLIVEFARRHNIVVRDPQEGKDIDLDNPGEFPPRWKLGCRAPGRRAHRSSIWRKMANWSMGKRARKRDLSHRDG